MTTVDSFHAFRTEVRARLERALEEIFTGLAVTEVSRAANYALLNGGQRWRGVLAVAAGRIFDPRALEIVMPGACGAECAHAASLVLDDLPSMDNAQIRRGRPCVHLVFPRWAVDMVPVFLIALAYRLILNLSPASYQRRALAAVEFSTAALRMTQGQTLDLTGQSRDGPLDGLLECYRLKTGTLCAAVAKAGAIICGADGGDAGLLESFGLNLGVAYQILDDLADKIASLEEMGKSPGMDAAKVTAVDLLGVDGARREAHDFKERALAQIDGFGPEAELLRELVGRTGWESLV